MQIAVEVEPASVATHEAAGFVEAVGAAAEFASRNEFHGGVVGVLHVMAAHIEPEPAQVRRLGLDGRGAVLRGPGGEQVGGVAADEGAVAGAHEGFGVGGLEV
jgi:hypothetical protein